MATNVVGKRTVSQSGVGAVKKYLSFQLASEQYAVEVSKVREIVSAQKITPVPNMPPEIKGVINLRGRVIPAIDLRLKLGFPPQGYSQKTCIIVVQPGEGNATQTGMIVDEVTEVSPLGSDIIQPTPDFGQIHAPKFVVGVAQVKGCVKLLLDLELALSPDDTARLEAVVSGGLN